MEDQLYINLMSDASKNYFPENKPWDFTVMLVEPLTLQGRWFIGLTEVEYTRKRSDAPQPRQTAIYCDICKPSITGDSKTSVLRYIPISRSKGRRVFHSPSSIVYLEVNKHSIDRIKISIKSADTSIEDLVELQPSRLSLHLVKCPPLVL